MYLVKISLVKISLHISALSILRKKVFLSLFFLIFPQSSRVHITRAVLEQFLSFAKYLDGLSHGAPLLKQLCDHILFNPAIWIHTPAKVIVHLNDVITPTETQSLFRWLCYIVFLKIRHKSKYF